MFTKKIRANLEQSFLELTSLNPLEKWEKIKKKVKEFTQQYSKEKANSKKEKMADLKEEITYIEDNLDVRNDSETLERLDGLETQLNDLIAEKTRGIIFRSKATWASEGEKNSKYFFSLEKSRYNARTLSTLITEGGEKVTDQEKILQLQQDFYTQLYAKDGSVKFTQENESGIFAKEGTEAVSEEEISSRELTNALNSLKSNRTPGPDGLTAEFYKQYWDILMKHLVEAI